MKTILVCLLAAALLLCGAGCATASPRLQDADYATQTITAGVTHSDFPGVAVGIDRLNIHDGSAELVVEWENDSECDVLYGASYTIERLENGEWASCAKQEELFFTGIGYELKAGSVRNKTYNLTDIFDVSAPGTYRFQTDCYVYVEPEKSEKCTLWAEFTVGFVKCPEDSKETGTALKYGTQYIRTNGSADSAEFPGIDIISGVQELNDYYTAYRDRFDLERREQVYSDSTVGFLDACEQYDTAFFEKNFLVFVRLEEGSSSIRHEVQSVERRADEKIAISIDTRAPEVCTDDMAQWHIILELSRDAEVSAPSDVLLYLDEQLVWDGDAVEAPKPDAAFKAPPEGTLIMPEGDLPLQTGGCSWFYEADGGAMTASIADQSVRPLNAKSLQPGYISSQYAETIYVFAPETGNYEPTNSIGYLVKLDWEAAPASVTYTCWPDTVWENSSTPSEEVVSHQDSAFYAKPGGYVYEITATWEDTGSGYYGTANYYVYITAGEEHIHSIPEEAQTVADPFVGYCGNTQTTLYIGERSYTFMAGCSVTLTDILYNLDYKMEKVCRCLPEYTVDTEFGTGYGINLTEGFARCEKGQADLTREQIAEIAAVIKWAESTSAQYPVNE